MFNYSIWQPWCEKKNKNQKKFSNFSKKSVKSPAKKYSIPRYIFISLIKEVILVFLENEHRLPKSTIFT